MKSYQMPMGLTGERVKEVFNLLVRANREQLERIKEDIEKRIERMKK